MKKIDVRADIKESEKKKTIETVLSLKGYMRKLLPAYRQASAENQEKLRQHNPVLNAVLQIIGE